MHGDNDIAMCHITYPFFYIVTFRINVICMRANNILYNAFDWILKRSHISQTIDGFTRKHDSAHVVEAKAIGRIKNIECYPCKYTLMFP